MKLRVVVADNNPDFLRTFVSVLGTEFEVVATAVDGESALRCVRHWRPDVAILDSGINGIELTKQVRACHTPPAVVICSVENDPEFVEAALQAGALGYVFKTRIATELISAVKSVVGGHRFVSQS